MSASPSDPSAQVQAQVGVRSEPARAARTGLRERGHAAWGWWSARPLLAAALLYALLSVVFVGQGLLPGMTLSSSDMLWSTAPWVSSAPPEVRWGGANFEIADAVTVFQPFFEHTRGVLPDVPLWNPNVMGGRPLLANAQAAIFSPFTFPAYVLSVWKALAVMAMLKLWVGAFGTFLFGRCLGMRFGGAFLAGLVYAFGTFFVVWLAWPLTNIFPLLPWMLLLTELLVRRPEPLRAAGLAGVVALAFFGGHPETSFHTIVFTCLYFAFRVLLAWWRAGRRPADLIRPSLAFGLAVAGGAAIAAVMLVPLFEFFLNSGDYERRLGWEPGHAELKHIGALFLNDYWGRPTQTPLTGIVSNRGFYAGALTLMLATAALIVRPTVLRVAFAVLGAVSLGIVLGIEPLFSVVTALPGFRTAHNGRMVIFLLFCLAMLAGWGLDELSRRERPPPRRRALVVAAAALIFSVPFAWMLAADTLSPSRLGPALEVAWGFADPPPPAAGAARDGDLLRAAGDPVPADVVGTIRLSALLQWLVVAGLGLALIAARMVGGRGRLRWILPAGAFVALAALVLAGDLFRANMGFNTAIPIDHARQPATEGIRYLQERAPNRFAGFNRPGIGQPLQPNLSMRYGLYDARGYDYPVVERYDDLWRATAAPPGEFIPPTSRAEPTQRSLRGMSLLSVSDVMQDPSDPLMRMPGLRLAYDGEDARIYHNLDALPRTYLVDRQRVVEGEDAALAATVDPSFDARRAVVTESEIAGIPRDDAGGSSAGSPGSSRIVGYEDERVAIETSARRRSLMVLTDVSYPGWRATVDGEPAELERVNYLVRGVSVPAGEHRVELTYEPVSWRIGWIVSLVAILAVAAAALAGWRARRRPRPGTRP